MNTTTLDEKRGGLKISPRLYHKHQTSSILQTDTGRMYCQKNSTQTQQIYYKKRPKEMQSPIISKSRVQKLTKGTLLTNQLPHYLLSLTAYLVVATLTGLFQNLELTRGVHGAPCPAETPLYGGAILDGSADEYQTYFAVDDDDLTIMVGMEWCLKDGLFGLVPAEHFRGFRPEIFSPTSGTSFQTFGTMDAPGDNCFQLAIDEEIMYFTVYSDINDSEGFVFEGYQGTEWVYRANGNEFSPRERLGGRPIGFRVWMGTGGQQNQPLLIAIVYNACNCPASSFIGSAQPADMVTDAVTGTNQVQNLAYQENYMEAVYEQNCGNYFIEVVPALSFLTLATSGASLSPQGLPFVDSLTLGATTVNDIGVYTLDMQIGQDVDEPSHGFTQPYRGTVATFSYAFTVTVNPCIISSFDNTGQVADISIQLGDLPVDSLGYSHVQTPTCGYEETVSVNGLPSFVVHDTNNKFFTVNTPTDASFVGQYPITVTSEIQVPDTAEKLSFTTFTQTHTFTVFVNPCQVTSLEILVPTSDVTYFIRDPTAVTSTPYSWEQINSDCQYPVTVTITNLPAFATHQPASSDFTVGTTSDLALIGEYVVSVQGEITFFTDSTKTTTQTLTQTFQFSIFMQPCQILSYSEDAIPGPIVYSIGNPSLTDGFYSFIEDLPCGYPQQYEITNLPAFATHNTAAKDFTIAQTNDLSLRGEYTVTLKATLFFPTDYTLSGVDSRVIQYDFVIVVQPCLVNDYLDVSTVGDMDYTLGQPGFNSAGSYQFDESPVCNYAETVVVDIPTEIASVFTHNLATQDFTIDSFSQQSLIGEYFVTITSSIQVPDSPTGTTFQTIDAVHTFRVLINPCQVNSYAVTQSPNDIIYEAGDPSIFSDPPFAFTASPDCNYPFIQDIQGKPFFVLLESGINRFKINQSSSISYVGVYDVIVKRTLIFDSDYTQTTQTILEAEFTFRVIVNPCIVTSYTPLPPAQDITYTVGAPQVNSPFYSFKEEPACGYQETVLVSDVPPFANHSTFTRTFNVPQTFDISLIGSYQVTIRADLEVPDDNTLTTYSFITVEQTFTIFVQPCEVTDYQSTLTVAQISYFIRDPSLTDGQYGFEQIPACGYPETITVTNLPAFAIHNTAPQDFTVNQITDLSLIGQYDVTLRGEIQVPTDYTKTAFDVLFVEYTFPIYIEPCQIASFVDNQTAGPIIYNIGAPDLTDGSYDFLQDLPCGYVETITMTGLEPFMIHNAANRDFTILQQTDLNLIGEYIITISATIQVPDDFTQSTFTPFTVTYPFSIFIEPCVVNTYTAITQVVELRYAIGNPATPDGFYDFEEDPQCGYAETVTLTNLPAFVTHNEPSSNFQILTSNLDDIGQYTVRIKSEILVPTDYTQSTFTPMFVEYDFLVTITECEVTDYVASQQVGDIQYNVGQGLLITGDYIFDEIPQCNYPETVIVTNLPIFAQHNDATSNFSLNTDFLSDIGSYEVTIRSEIQIPDDFTSTTFTTLFAEYIFTIFVQPCIVTDFVQTQTVLDISYTVGEPFEISNTYLFEQIPACGYDQTLTVTDLPTQLATHLVIDKLFEIFTTNIDDIGQYPVTIRSEIQVPTDYTQTTFNTVFKEQIFTIFVEPCIVTDYLPNPEIIEINYFIGTPDLVEGEYAFEQIPGCSYPETITVTNLPAFVTQNVGPQDFTVPQTSDLTLIGQYDVTMRGEISVPTDSSKTSFNIIFFEYSFPIFMQPCQIISYTDTLRAGPITYFLGTPELTDGDYVFTQDPTCGYPETITVSNLPFFATHNPADFDFTISQLTDLALIGEYDVTIEASISVPDDYTQLTFTDYPVSYTFKIYVEPCLVTDYVASTQIVEIKYNVNEPPKTDGLYVFDEIPGCGYAETVTLTNLPPFVTHNEPSSNFQVFTSDLNDIGSYTVTIRSEISVPTDYTMTTYQTLFVEYDFLILVDECLVTDYVSNQLVGDIFYNIGSGPITTGDYLFEEIPACGYAETVTITNLPIQFATHNESTSNFSLDTSDLADLGSYIVTIRSEISIPTDFTLTTYQTLFVEYDFTIFIEPCLITDYVASQETQDLSYFVGDPLATSTTYAFEQQPNCGYTESVTVTGLPLFATHDKTGQFFTVQTSDTANIGQYIVSVQSEFVVPDDFSNTSQTTITQLFTFTIFVEPCQITDYIAAPPVNQLEYFIGAVSLTDATYAFEQIPSCTYPEVYTITNPHTFVIHNNLSQDFTVPQTSDLALIGSYPITIRAEMNVPTDSSKTAFDVIFVEYTFPVLMQPCQITDYFDEVRAGPINYHIGEPDLTDGAYLFTQVQACGYPETISVVNLESWMIHNDAAKDFTIQRQTDLGLMGEYLITMNAEISVPDDYTQLSFTTYPVSYVFSIFVQPCKVFTYNAITLVDTLEYNIGQPATPDGFYDFEEDPQCGYAETVTLTNLPAFVTHNEPSSNFQIFTSNLDDIGQYTVRIKSEILVPTDYTQSTFTPMSVEYDFNVLVQQCVITDYVATQQVGDLSYNVGTGLLTMGDYIFDEIPPCGYTETVTVTNLPPFAIHNEPASNFSIETADLADIGSYVVTIRSEIQVPTDFTQTSFTTFFVEYDFTIFVEPCLITDYFAIIEVPDITYNVGQGSLTTGNYFNVQTPGCGYPETISTTDLPTFAIQNTASKDFTLETVSLGDIGRYTVSYEGQIQQPNDYTQTTFTPWLISYTFDIIVEPCLVSTYVDTLQVGTIVYNIGQPDLTAGDYIFDENPQCGYPETVTITNLPVWATHNEPTSDFTIPKQTSLALLGFYTARIRSEIQVPTDYTQTVFTTLFVEYDFFIQVEECVVTSYQVTQTIPLFFYAIGAPDQTSTKYIFDETPVCNYAETVILTGLPPFVTHNELSSDFTIISNPDLALIGRYPVTIRSEIKVPDDFTGTSYTTFGDEFEMIIEIGPCVVNQYDATLTVPTLIITIGSATTTLGNYVFDESPFCNYPETVTVTNLPTFAQHNEPTSDFDIFQTTDLSLAGDYPVTLRSEIQVPDDYSQTTFTTLFQEYVFIIRMVDPCPSSTFQVFEIDDMVRSVFQVELFQLLNPVQDDTSQTYGDQTGLTFCGARQFEITTTPVTYYSSYLSFDTFNETLRAQTDLFTDIGIYDLEMKVFLIDYPSVSSLATFQVIIGDCQVTDLDQNLVPRQIYDVYTPQISWSVDEFVQTPACQYTLEYKYEIKDPLTNIYGSLPPFITVPSRLNFEVFTMDPAYVGLYYVAITASVPTAFMNPTYSEELLVELEVKNSCILDEVEVTGILADQIPYYINEDGIVPFDPTWTHTLTGCPITYEIGRVETGIERPLNPVEIAVLNHSTLDGSARLQATDYALDGQIWEIKIYMQSTYSETSKKDGVYLVTIEFRDICWDSTLDAAEFLQPTYKFDLWQLQSMLYERMEDLSQGLACGGYTHELQYVSGPVFDPTLAPVFADLTHYADTPTGVPGTTQNEISGSIGDFNWLGSHKLRIKSTNGKFDPDPSARGDQGLFNSEFSAEITLEIINPCLTSVVNGDSVLDVIDVAVPVGSTQTNINYAGPTDSTSVTYGNGHDKCGNLEYVFLDETATDPFSLAVFSQSTTVNNDLADSFELSLQSEAVGTELQATFTLTISLVDYPSAIPATFLVNLFYRECFPVSFVGPEVEDKVVTVGDPEQRFSYIFDQSPCQWDQSYKVVQINTRTGAETSLPKFVTLESLSFIMGVTDRSDVGEYLISISSKIQNSLVTERERQFRIEVIAPPDIEIIVSKKPKFLVQLEDQRVRVGQPLIYEPLVQVNTYGYIMDLQVDIGSTYPFASYDEEKNIYKVAGGETTRSDIGIYEIVIIATFYNETFSEQYAESFFLTVWDDPIPPPPYPDETIFYPEWDFAVKETFEPEPFDPDKPIPFIESLSSTGVLTIGWDREMVRPANISVIPPAKVAIKDWANLDDYRRLRPPRRMLQDQTYMLPPELEKLPNGTFAYTQVDDPSLVWFANRGDRYAERRKLIDALELRITPEDSEIGIKVNFTWDILGYSEEFIWLQLYILNPWEISQTEQQLDTLSVTFWGTEYFKSQQGKEVRYGTTLYHPILRQINPIEGDGIDNLSYLNGWAYASILLILPFASLGSLLPTWMFINSLQIIAHMPLMNSLMPGNAHYFLTKYLDMVRWRNKDFNKWLDGYVNWKDYDVDVGFFHLLLKEGGYEHLYAENLVLILAGVVLICLIWVGLAAKDYIGRWRRDQRKFMKKRHEPRCQNFITRFAYEFFLEFCICIFINVSITDFTDVQPGFHFVTSIIFMLLLIAVFVYIGLLFFNDGPHVNGYYKEGTYFESLWGARAINDQFDVKDHLRRNKKKPKIPKHWFRFTLSKTVNKIEETPEQKNDYPSENQMRFAVGSPSPDAKKDRFRSTQTLMDRMATDQRFLTDNEAPLNQQIYNQESAEKANVPGLDPFTNGKLFKFKSNPAAINYLKGIRSGSGETLPASNSRELVAVAVTNVNSVENSNNLTANQNNFQRDEENQNLQDHHHIESPYIQENGGLHDGSSVEVEIVPNQLLGQPEVDPNMINQIPLHSRFNSTTSQEQLFEGGQYDRNIVLPTESDYPEFTARKLSPNMPGTPDEIGNIAPQGDPKTNDAVFQSKKKSRRNFDQKNQLKHVRKRARQQVKLENTVQKPKRYRTIYYGLKLNHPRNVALVHPIMFFSRRIIYALIIVCMDTVTFWNILLFIFTTLIMLGYVLTEHQWQDRIINKQHIVNEITIYILGVLLLCFSNFVEPHVRYLLGFLLIGIVFAFVIYNTIIMLLYSLRLWILFMRREYTRMVKRGIQKEVDEVVEKIEEDINSWPGKEKQWFIPDELEKEILQSLFTQIYHILDFS